MLNYIQNIIGWILQKGKLGKKWGSEDDLVNKVLQKTWVSFPSRAGWQLPISSVLGEGRGETVNRHRVVSTCVKVVLWRVSVAKPPPPTALEPRHSVGLLWWASVLDGIFTMPHCVFEVTCFFILQRIITNLAWFSEENLDLWKMLVLFKGHGDLKRPWCLAKCILGYP